MSALAYLIPVALFLGLLGLAAFLWALKSGQFEDLDGAAHRILFDDDEAQPKPRSDPDRHASLHGRPKGKSGSNR
jgi:cbb3-type cytochrome oxidase maturation protein